MTQTTVSSREFNQHVSAAKKAADKGPVIITDRGKPAYVLMKFEDFRKQTGKPKSLLDSIAQPGGPEYDFDFEPPRFNDLPRPVDLD